MAENQTSYNQIEMQVLRYLQTGFAGQVTNAEQFVELLKKLEAADPKRFIDFSNHVAEKLANIEPLESLEEELVKDLQIDVHEEISQGNTQAKEDTQRLRRTLQAKKALAGRVKTFANFRTEELGSAPWQPVVDPDRKIEPLNLLYSKGGGRQEAWAAVPPPETPTLFAADFLERHPGVYDDLIGKLETLDKQVKKAKANETRQEKPSQVLRGSHETTLLFLDLMAIRHENPRLSGIGGSVWATVNDEAKEILGEKVHGKAEEDRTIGWLLGGAYHTTGGAKPEEHRERVKGTPVVPLTR